MSCTDAVSVLNQKCIWVTRPEQQSASLCQLLKAEAARVVRFPVIEIVPIINNTTVAERLAGINDYRFVIFISQNAAANAFQYYLHDTASFSPQFVAIGQATARCLQQQGVSQLMRGGAAADSEALLSLPVFQSEAIRGNNVLLVRGKGGRELLGEELNKRGARVDIVEVYSRNLPQYTTAHSRKLWQVQAPDAIIVTSNEALQNLQQLTPDSAKPQLYHTPLVLMSERILEQANITGFVGNMVAAIERSDAGLLKALEQMLGDE